MIVNRMISKCKRQKSISAHLVLEVMMKLIKDRDKAKCKTIEVQHYSSKHMQLLKNENKELKRKIRELEGNR